MQELADERKAVRQALEEVYLSPFVYENDAGARPTTAQHTFSNELHKADLYIGIFWKGYGQYTIQEFEEARTLRKPCFIYEKQANISERDAKLIDFLSEVNNVRGGLTVRRFDTLDELRLGVKDDVSQWIASVVRSYAGDPTGLLPEQLPCLCNRDPQDKTLTDQVSTHLTARLRRPLVIALKGHKFDGHYHYIERVRSRSALEWLTKFNMGPFREILRISESISGTQTLEEFSKDLRSRLAPKLKDYTDDNGMLVRYMRNKRLSALIIVFTVNSSEYEQEKCTFVQRVCEYVAELPDTLEGTFLGFLICLKYGSRQAGKSIVRQLTGLFSSSYHIDEDNVFKADLDHCRHIYGENSKTVRFIELPTLLPITQNDVERWVDREEVRRHVHPKAFMNIERFFEDRRSLRFEEAYEKMLQLIGGQIPPSRRPDEVSLHRRQS